MTAPPDLTEQTSDTPPPTAFAARGSWRTWHSVGLALAIIVGAAVVLWPRSERPSRPTRSATSASSLQVQRVHPGPASLEQPGIARSAVRVEAKPQPLPAGKQTARLLPPAPDVAAKSDDELAAALVGRWRTNLYGVQTIQNQPGGVASLEAQLDFLSSLLYGSELKMDLEWSVVQGVLTHKIIRGEPEKSVQRLMQDQGDRRSYRILELTESRLKLQNIDEPETVRIWTRMP